jgi:hypothetical protein
MKTYEGVEVHLHIFLTSEPVWGDWSPAGPNELSPGIKPPVLIGYEAGLAPEPEWMLRSTLKSPALARNWSNGIPKQNRTAVYTKVVPVLN